MRRINKDKLKYSPHLGMEAFRASGFLIINKTLIKHFGPLKSILLSYYVDRHNYFFRNNKDFDGWFFTTHEKIVEELNIPEKTIRSIKKFFMEKEILYSNRKGLPAKEYFYIDFGKITEYLGIEKSIPVLPGRVGLDIPGRVGLINKTIYIFKKINKKDFENAWTTWKEYKREQFNFIYKSQSSEQAAMSQLYKLSKAHGPTAVEIINQSIANGWKGFFGLVNSKPTFTKNNNHNNAQVTNNITPKQVFKNHKILYKYYVDLLEHKSCLDKIPVANAICNLNDVLKQKIPHSETQILDDYIWYLGNSNWIKDIGPNLFSWDNSIFQKWFRKYSDDNNL